MIKIGVPYIERGEEYSKLNCDVIIGEKENKIWLEVDKIYNDYLCTERCDASLIFYLCNYWRKLSLNSFQCKNKSLLKF